MKVFWFIVALVGTAFYIVPLTPLAKKPSLATLFRETPETFLFWGMEFHKQMMFFFICGYFLTLIIMVIFLIETIINLFRKEERWGSTEGIN